MARAHDTFAQSWDAHAPTAHTPATVSIGQAILCCTSALQACARQISCRCVSIGLALVNWGAWSTAALKPDWPFCKSFDASRTLSLNNVRQAHVGQRALHKLWVNIVPASRTNVK